MYLYKRSKDFRQGGFTLTELIVVIVIFGILAIIAVPIVSQSRTWASSSHSVSNLRQIATSIQLYATDHSGYLPGPVWAGQGPYFGVPNDPSGRNGNLAHHLRDYLPVQYIEKRGYNPIFDYPRWRSNARDIRGPSYFINRGFRFEGRWYEPFGASRVGAVNERTETMTVFQLSSHELRGKIVMHELDDTLVSDSAGWRVMLPEKPVHGNHHNALYYDWSVRAVPLGHPLNP